MRKAFRLVIIIVLAISFVFLVSGCAKRGKCDNCGQTEKLNRYVDPGNGTVYWLCDACYNLAKMFTWR